MRSHDILSVFCANTHDSDVSFSSDKRPDLKTWLGVFTSSVLGQATSPLLGFVPLLGRRKVNLYTPSQVGQLLRFPDVVSGATQYEST